MSISWNGWSAGYVLAPVPPAIVELAQLACRSLAWTFAGEFMVSMPHAKCGLAMHICRGNFMLISAAFLSIQHAAFAGWRTHKLINFRCGFQRVITAARSPLAICSWDIYPRAQGQLRSIKRMVKTHYRRAVRIRESIPKGIKDNRGRRARYATSAGNVLPRNLILMQTRPGGCPTSC